MSLRNSVFRTLSIGLLASALWACGQAGPLYLPQDTEQETNQQDADQPETNQQAQQQNQSERLTAVEPLQPEQEK